MNVLVTGGAGFIGSNLVDKLMNKGHNVTVFDNLSSGRQEFIAHHEGKPNFRFVKRDLLDFEGIRRATEGQEIVFHLAANPDIRYGTEKTDFDLKQNTLATYNVLEAMRQRGVKKIVFSSTSAVYGMAKKFPTPEHYGPMLPESLYGASKLACEGLISAYCELFEMQGWIFRFANVVGRNGTHGVILDFINRLEKNRDELEILGDGEQEKSYILADELVEGILFGLEHANERVNIYNLGCNDQIKVKRIAELVCKEMGLKPRFRFTGGERGWKGDIPKMLLSTEKIKRLGWAPKHNSEGAVIEAIKLITKVSNCIF